MGSTPDHTNVAAVSSLGAICGIGALSLYLALGDGVALWAATGAWTLFGVATAAMAWFGLVSPLAQSLEREHAARLDQERQTAAQRERRRLVTRIERALDDAQNEPELVELLARTLVEILPDRDNSILLCRGDDLRVSWVLPVLSDGMGVPTELSARTRCGALVAGHTTTTESSTDIGACAHASADAAVVSSACVPIPLGDGFLGVAWSAGAPGDVPDDDELDVVEMACRRVGTRIATLRHDRAMRSDRSRGDLSSLPHQREAYRMASGEMSSGGDCAMALCDIDGFASYNDVHGTEEGDRALAVLIDVIDATLRPSDIIARHGGDCFVAVLTSCSASQAAAAMERLREALILTLATTDVEPFAFSAGVADSASGLDVSAMVDAAGIALRDAKMAGGNRVQIAQFSDASFADPDELRG